MKRPKEPATTNAEQVRVYTWRVYKIFTAALNGKGEGRRAWLAVPKGDTERSRYLALRRAAEKVAAYVDDCEQKGNLEPIDMMNQFALLKGIWEQWRERRAKPIWENYRSVQAKRKSAASKKSELAYLKANQQFEAWCLAPKRHKELEGRSDAEKLKKFYKVACPKRSVRRQLRKHPAVK
jgi:hypothetical protein